MRGILKAAVVAMGIMSTGCLVTDELIPRESLPVPANHPPRFVEESIQPKNWSVIPSTADADCRQIELVIGTVVDEDLEDDLTARWFIDYDPSAGAPRTYYDGGPLLSAPSVDGVRAGGEPLRFALIEPSRPLSKGVHVFKVVVSDGFDPSGLDAVRSGKSIVSYSWTVDTSLCTGGTQ